MKRTNVKDFFASNRSWAKHVLVAIISWLLAVQLGIAQAQPTANLSHPLKISAGDLLSVDVFDTPELSAKPRVSEKGEIALPVGGDVLVAGLTAEEAANRIEQRFRDHEILKNPHVSVFVQEFATQGVSILGEVKSPGVYPVFGTHGLLDFISMAGGVTATAGKAVTITHKDNTEHPQIVQLDNAPDMAVRAGVDILPGDTIVVSRSGIVYLVGDFVKPGGFLIENNDRLTVLQATALAQGTNRTASLSHAKLIRKTASGRQEIPVQLKKLLAGKLDDFRLEDGDILFVPSSEVKAMAYRGLEATVGLATGMVIYGRY